MKSQTEYKELLASGMFFEFYPQLSGDWIRDGEQWIEIHKELTVLRNEYSDKKEI
jgi:hypothetical protein